MGKIDCVLVLSGREFLKEAVNRLNFDKVNLVAALADVNEKEYFSFGEKYIPVHPFALIDRIVPNCKNFIWLTVGREKNFNLRKMKNFLMTFGIEEKNIVEFDMARQKSSVWLANYHHVEKNGADFFATGDEYFRDALNLKFIPCVHEDKTISLGGANLADVNQSLEQSYLIAKNIFAHVKPGTIKFVLIGLSPQSLYRDSGEIFFESDFLESENEEQADLNFDELKKDYDRAFSTQSVFDWEKNMHEVSGNSFEKNSQVLEDYINLCLDNGAKPVGVVLPFAPAVRKNFDRKILNSFREKIHQLEEKGDFFCIDMFEQSLDYQCFCDMLHLNADGSMFATALIALKLHLKGLIPAESFCDMSYRHLNRMSWLAEKDEFSKFAESMLNRIKEKIRRKKKIKIAFVTIDSAQWCGDDLYNLFAQDERFETTIFDCLRLDKEDNDLIVKDFWRGVEQLKKRNLNVIAVDKDDMPVPEQDIFFLLTPYFFALPKALRHENLLLKSLLTHIPYSFDVSFREKSYYDSAIFNTAWKIFFSSKIAVDLYATENRFGLPRGIFSGYPRMDIFFDKNANFHFDWKMTRPDAKKIIYAPHWSINSVTRYATFQWNYKFMYEFAKAHPEISWVVKPHQALFFSSVEEKVFPSTADYEEYLQKWDDLPNAQVYTGAYYQDLFATSDGMIHDSGSFIAEYQFVNKPMIFLTREGEVFNKLAEEILNASYLVDGKDLDAIAEMMKKAFIEGDDYKAAERKKVFDKYLNYPEYNGMLASEFIYRSIADELKEESE